MVVGVVVVRGVVGGRIVVGLIIRGVVEVVVEIIVVGVERTVVKGA